MRIEKLWMEDTVTVIDFTVFLHIMKYLMKYSEVRPRFVHCVCEVCVALKFAWLPNCHLDNLRIRYMQDQTESIILS